MKRINQLSTEDAIYIAGLFDGEGTIYLGKNSRLTEPQKTPTYLLRASVKMSNEDIVKWLYVTIGGRFYRNVWPRKPQYKPYFQWDIVGRNVVSFLQQIYPYLRVKRLQAEVAFKYGETICKFGWQGKMSPEIVERREQLRSQMLSLNQRGRLN